MSFEFGILPLCNTKKEYASEYWRTLVEADLLKYRLGDIKDPQLDDAYKLIHDFFDTMFFIVYEGRIVAEITLCNFTGEAAQLHFSMHPSNDTTLNRAVGTWSTSNILDKWTKRDSPQSPYLSTLYGLTPTPNRIACLFVLRTGFKKVGVLPMGTNHFGVPCDGMITAKTRKS